MPDRRRRRATAERLEGRRRAATVGRRIGNGLRDSRLALRLPQTEAAQRAGISQASWSRVERGIAGAASLETLACCAAAVGTQLAAFIEARPGADLPRDIEHLRRQELVIELARPGGWTAQPELAIDPHAERSRSIDVHLARFNGAELAVVEIVDLVTDGGAEFRNLTDKVAAVRRTWANGARVRGLLVLRATARNRATVAEFPALFAARFTGSSSQWLRALADPAIAMPDGDGIVWSSARGDRLVAVSLRRGVFTERVSRSVTTRSRSDQPSRA
jgi:transcriptional regulator with XRE-family HTH domain